MAVEEASVQEDIIGVLENHGIETAGDMLDCLGPVVIGTIQSCGATRAEQQKMLNDFCERLRVVWGTQ